MVYKQPEQHESCTTSRKARKLVEQIIIGSASFHGLLSVHMKDRLPWGAKLSSACVGPLFDPAYQLIDPLFDFTCM